MRCSSAEGKGRGYPSLYLDGQEKGEFMSHGPQKRGKRSFEKLIFR